MYSALIRTVHMRNRMHYMIVRTEVGRADLEFMIYGMNAECFKHLFAA